MKLNHALAAGNTVVLKPSPLTPLAGLALARLIDEHTDIPPGVVNVVTPSGVEAAKLLTTDPRIDMVSFTGSSVVGRQVMSAAGDTMKRILLELGGKSASIVLDDAEVTDEMLQQMLFDSPARCTPGRPASCTAGCCFPIRCTTTWSTGWWRWPARSRSAIPPIPTCRWGR